MATWRLGLPHESGAGARGFSGKRDAHGSSRPGPPGARLSLGRRSGPSAPTGGLRGGGGGRRGRGAGRRAPPPFHPTSQRRPGALAPRPRPAPPRRAPGEGSAPRPPPPIARVSPSGPSTLPSPDAAAAPATPSARSPECARNSRPAHFKGPPGTSKRAGRPPPRPRTHHRGPRARPRPDLAGAPGRAPAPDRLAAAAPGPRAGPGVGGEWERPGRECGEPGGEEAAAARPAAPCVCGKDPSSLPCRGRPGPLPPAPPAGLSTRAPLPAQAAPRTPVLPALPNKTAPRTSLCTSKRRGPAHGPERRLPGACAPPPRPAAPLRARPARRPSPASPRPRPGRSPSGPRRSRRGRARPRPRPACAAGPGRASAPPSGVAGGGDPGGPARAAPRFMVASASLHFPAPGGARSCQDLIKAPPALRARPAA